MEHILTCTNKTTVYYDYRPDAFEPVHTQRNFVVYAGDVKFNTFEEALADAGQIGLKKLIDEKGFDLIIINPFTDAWETEGEAEARCMFEKLIEILKDKGEGYVWYWQRDLISFVGNRRGADFISQYCAAAYPAPTIVEGFFLKIMAQSVTLFYPTKPPCDSGKYVSEASGKLLPAFIVNGSPAVIEGYKKFNETGEGSVVKFGCTVYESIKEKAIVAITEDESNAIKNAYELVMSTFRRRNLGDEPLASVPRPNLGHIGISLTEHREHLDANNPDEEYHWYEYVPTDLEPGKKVPLVLVLHGGGENGQYIMEMTRWAFIAMKEGLICAAMTNHSVEKNSVLLTHLLNTLPVDAERCYATGFSMGGMSSSGVGLVDNRFAGVAPQDGMIFEVNGYTPEIMPLFYISGANDSAFPLVTRTEPEGGAAIPRLGNHAAKGEQGPPPPSDAQKAAAANARRVFRRSQIILNNIAEALNCYFDKNGVEMRYWSPLQFAGEKNKYAVDLQNIFETSDVIGGHKFTIGDLPSKNGEVYVRLGWIDGLGHDVHPNTAEFIWEFFKQFRRTSDGKIIKG